MADLGLLGWVWLGIQLGGSHPLLHPPPWGIGRRGQGISSLDVGRQMFCLLAKLTFPFGSGFHLSVSSLFLTLPYPWLGAGEPSGHWLAGSWGTWGPVPPLLADLTLEGQHQLRSLCSPELASSGCSLVWFQAALHTSCSPQSCLQDPGDRLHGKGVTVSLLSVCGGVWWSHGGCRVSPARGSSPPASCCP